MGKILLAPFFTVCLSLPGCKSPSKNYPVEPVDRNALFAFNQKPNPLMLIVSIDENRKLRLNKIETGTIADSSVLTEKLQAIFDDRERVGIDEREVIIDPQGNAGDEDLEKLIESLAVVKAAPIRLVTYE